jgi:DNA repair exonuclease SbcCD ATPase subunit
MFNKKKWLKNHLDDILRLKNDGLTHSSIIQALKKEQNMPFDLDESMLSRYLKEFTADKLATIETKTALVNKVDRQRERLTRLNNEIQNLKRRLDRMAEREVKLEIANTNLKERNRILENKFLDGDARLEELLHYKGLHNSRWKIAELEQKNDDLFQTVLTLERRCEKLAEPHQQANEKVTGLENELSQIKQEYKELEQNQVLSNQKIQQLELTINALKNEKQTLEKQLAEKKTPVIHQDQEKIEELSRERQQFLKERNQLEMLSKRLKSDLSNTNHQLDEVSNQLYKSRNNAKQKDLWRVFAFSFAGIAFILFLALIFI